VERATAKHDLPGLHCIFEERAETWLFGNLTAKVLRSAIQIFYIIIIIACAGSKASAEK
jgi:hypothetical protein